MSEKKERARDVGRRAREGEGKFFFSGSRKFRLGASGFQRALSLLEGNAE